jgi:hypothetical protein
MTRFLSNLTSLAIAATVLTGFGASAEIISFKSDLSGANEVPPLEAGGKGALAATYDSDTKMLTYTVEYSGLSGPVTAAHFHGPSDTSHNAPVLIPVSGGLTNPMQGSASLTDAQAADLLAGRLYFNVHTAKNRPGEIRGQVLKDK